MKKYFEEQKKKGKSEMATDDVRTSPCKCK